MRPLAPRRRSSPTTTTCQRTTTSQRWVALATTTAMVAAITAAVGCRRSNDAVEAKPTLDSTEVSAKDNVSAKGDKRTTTPAGEHAPTLAEAKTFIRDTEATLLRLWIERERAGWVKATHITDDTERIAADAEIAVMKVVAEKAADARRYAKLSLDAVSARKLELLRLTQTLPAPLEAKARDELAHVATALESRYGKGRWCPPAETPGPSGERAKAGRGAQVEANAMDPKRNDAECMDLGQLSERMATSRDPAELLAIWQGWRTIALPMRAEFRRYVELGNAGAQALGFHDLGELWRSRYDLSAAAFEAEVDRLWTQVQPLYEQLHCYARARLSARYGADVVSLDGPIPAHLLGNMWAQDWVNIADVLAPPTGAGPKRKRPDDGTSALTRLLRSRQTTPEQMVRYAEGFFTSLGFAPLPETFWRRSMLVKPRDREVVCHASAWDIDRQDDIRIKMCIERTEEDFVTIHHELGHNIYERAYKEQPPLFTDSANKGFHEALGDTIALSVTPAYLRRVGLGEGVEEGADDIAMLLGRALEKIAFLPFGVVIDKWRWQVLDGRVPPERWNQAWWQLRERYQGVAAPVARRPDDFDPGAKYHIAGGVPYIRYFIAHIVQFQFHRALCRIAGYNGPLHRCSIYGSKAAGERLQAMMAMGLSKPWPDALEALTGEREMDAGALLDYFAPLHKWLVDQNAGRECGWPAATQPKPGTDR